jgi:hypothetical protein
MFDASIDGSTSKKLRGLSVSKIIQQPDIRLNFTREEIEQKIDEIICKIRLVELPKMKEELQNSLKDLEEFIDSEIGDWRFIIPIENLKVSNILIDKILISRARLYYIGSATNSHEESKNLLCLNSTYYNSCLVSSQHGSRC